MRTSPSTWKYSLLASSSRVVILEHSLDGSVVCCAIDSCIHPLEGAALEGHLRKIRAKVHDPDLTAAAAAFEMLCGEALRNSQLDAIRCGWRHGIEKIREMTRDGALQAALDAYVAGAVAAGASPGELSKACAYLLTVAWAIADLSGTADGVPAPQRTLSATSSPDARPHPENRLSGSSSLGTFLAEVCSSLPADAVPLFAFDFDKTLTNGLATLGACLQARVRGGTHTLDGLKATTLVPHSRRCIITARADETGRVSQGKLQQVLSQLHKAQPELLEFFEVGSDESHGIVELVPEAPPTSSVASESASQGGSTSPGTSPGLPHHAWRWRDVPKASWGPGMYATLQGDGRPILFGGGVYASGYNKSLALLHACTAEAAFTPTHIFFIDDAPNNAYEVQRDLPVWLRQWSAQRVGQEPAAEPVLRSIWWDLFEEEFETKTIAPTTSGPDFAYLRDGAHRDFLYSPALRHFGLSESDIVERARQYEHTQRERDAQQAAKVADLNLSGAKGETPRASQPSVLERRRQVHELLIANGRVPRD